MEDSRLLQLSPSRATDFKSCPQLFKYRSIDRVPEPLSRGAAVGSIVHAILERLFAEPGEGRTPQRAADLLNALWKELREDPEFRLGELSDEEQATWLSESHRLLSNYFRLEDPRRLNAARLEWWVNYQLAELDLRGIIDRVEEGPDGAWILTDYKTGRIPGESRELTAFFGLRFYALVCWRAFNVMPTEIRLVYLTDPAVLTLRPNERMLLAFERQMHALGKAIRRALERDDWRPRPSPFCLSCPFQDRCPAWAETTAERFET